MLILKCQIMTSPGSDISSHQVGNTSSAPTYLKALVYLSSSHSMAHLTPPFLMLQGRPHLESSLFRHPGIGINVPWLHLNARRTHSVVLAWLDLMGFMESSECQCVYKSEAD